MAKTYERQSEPAHWNRFVIPGTPFHTYMGRNYEFGELIELVAHPGNEKLLRLRYIDPVPDDAQTVQCGVCGKLFLSERWRSKHGNTFHNDRFVDSGMQISGGIETHMGTTGVRDVTGDTEERRMMAEFPLALDRTKATLDS